ncbi:helix-turn-helix domain-containing protein [Mycobacterium canetti]|uniref:helix-turn-helix domain-containing protein n=1 Tax=Mycobacterium canetti TaxID=78331 RepID=UPI0032E46F6C
MTAPSGETVGYLVAAKRLLIRRDVPTITERLRQTLARERDNTEAMVMSRYLAPPIREALMEEDMSFIDATSNMLVQSSRPTLFVRDRGADKDPWRGPGRPRGTLAGEPAARVVRTLVEARGPWSARDLVKASGASTGATYRVLEFLQEEGLVDKTAEGYAVRDWPGLLRRWSRDYGFLRTNRTFTYIEPRGIDALLRKAADSNYARYAVTGSTAGAQWVSTVT